MHMHRVHRVRAAVFFAVTASVLGGWTALARSCCEEHTCANLRMAKVMIATGYAQCCQQEGQERSACLSALSGKTATLHSLILQAQIACQQGDVEWARDLVRQIKELLKGIGEVVAVQSIQQVDGVPENTIPLLGEGDWISLSATLPRRAGAPGRSQATATVGGARVLAEAAGGTAELQGDAAAAATIVPSGGDGALVAYDHDFPTDSTITIRTSGQSFQGTINGAITLAPLEAVAGALRAVPTDVSWRVRSGPATVTLTLDRTSPFNLLKADANGQGTLEVVLLVDSKSAALAPSLYMGERYYFRFPVQVGAGLSNIQFSLTSEMPGSGYAPASAMALNAADGNSTAPIGGDVCADVDGNHIRDGADEVIRVINLTSGCPDG